jgi:hypothetical protein
MGDWGWLDQNCDVPVCVAIIGTLVVLALLVFT